MHRCKGHDGLFDGTERVAVQFELALLAHQGAELLEMCDPSRHESFDTSACGLQTLAQFALLRVFAGTAAGLEAC